MTQAEAVQLVVPGGRLTQGYGMTAYAKSGAYGGRIHDGWDIGAGYGTRINWPVPVSSFRWGFEAGGYGNYTQGFVGPWEFLFGHEAQVGNQSYAGLVDSTGFSSGNHTHLRVKLNGVTVDPQVFFNSIGGSVAVQDTPEYKELYKHADHLNTFSVAGIWHRFIGKEPTGAEYAFWKPKTPGETVKGVWASQARKDAINDLFMKILKRPAKPEDYKLRYEQSLPEMARDLLDSQEYKDLQGEAQEKLDDIDKIIHEGGDI